MNIKFKNVKIHHFLSFDEAEIELNDRGFCLVSGTNKNPNDAAKSNGSGKSSIWNAISYALTGETINGLKSNLGNIKFNDGCWVEINFNVDNDSYKLIRSKDDKKLKTNLKIIVNGEDKSGKGIRESQDILNQLLPDLTNELLGSVVILGQGLPQKFTSNSPVGRKEVLEHLSKSDFMIQDIKKRISDRETSLNNSLRDVEDKLLVNNTNINLYTSQLEILTNELSNLNNENELKSLLEFNKNKYEEYSSKSKCILETIEKLNDDYKLYNEKVLNEVNIKQDRLEKVNKQHKEFSDELSSKKVKLLGDIHSLEIEIKRLKSITDICPTCGQKLPNIIKPSTDIQENELKKLKLNLSILEEDIKNDDINYSQVLKNIEDDFNNNTKDNKSNIFNTLQEISAKSKEKETITNEMIKISNEIANLTSSINEFNNNKSKLEKQLNDTKNEIKELNENKLYNISVKENIKKHFDIINKMNSLVKRDFRGYLLKNVIEFIDLKSKEYATKIFNTNDIKFELDGNNISIIFCDKEYENLSGGEKQRVDLIIQFAIRDMLCQYLNFNSNILVLDEITDALDSVSCDKVINFISNDLNYIESIFIISHHSDELAIPYDSTIRVEKNYEGISQII